MIRRLLFQVHMWIGLVLGVLFVALGLSGSVLVYGDAIDRLTAPLPRASASGPPQPLDRLIAAGLPANPNPQGAVFLVLPKRTGDPAIVRFPPSGISVFVDPVTARVLGSRTSFMSPMVQLAHDLHGDLFMGPDGRPYVGRLGIGMLLLGVTGLVLWWPRARQWKLAFIVRRAAKGLRFHRELHGAAGIWGFIVFIIVTFTGVGMVFPDTIRSVLGGGGIPAAFDPAALVLPAGKTASGADVAAALAQKKLPLDRVRAIVLPPARPIGVVMSADDDAAIPTLVYVDPFRARVVGLWDPSNLSGPDAFLAWQKPLHVGDGLGPVWRFLVFLSGFLPLLFVATGVTMWLKKRRNRIAMNRPLRESSVH